MRTLASMLAVLEDDAVGLIIPGEKPYEMDGEGYIIGLAPRAANHSLYSLVYIHEDKTPISFTDGELEDLKKAASEDKASEEDERDYQFALLMKHMEENFDNYKKWYMLLVACEQVREQTEANLENFSKMCRAPPLPAKTKSYLSYFAGKQERFVENAAIRLGFISNKYFEYHTTGSSTPNLCSKALQESSGLGMFTPDEVATIRGAVANKTDIMAARFINDVTLVKARCVLESCGSLPDVWYMGQRALENLSAVKYSALLKYLKEILKRITKTDELESLSNEILMKNLEELVKSFGTGKEGGEGMPPTVTSAMRYTARLDSVDEIKDSFLETKDKIDRANKKSFPKTARRGIAKEKYTAKVRETYVQRREACIAYGKKMAKYLLEAKDFFADMTDEERDATDPFPDVDPDSMIVPGLAAPFAKGTEFVPATIPGEGGVALTEGTLSDVQKEFNDFLETIDDDDPEIFSDFVFDLFKAMEKEGGDEEEKFDA